MYTTIIHPIRRAYNLSLNEYCILDSIYMLSNNEKYGGWCIMSKQKIAEELDLSEKTVQRAILALEAKGLIKKSEAKFLRTTDEWNELVANKHDYMIAFNGKEQQFITGKLQQKAEISIDTDKLSTTKTNSLNTRTKSPTDTDKLSYNNIQYSNIDISSKEETRYGEFKNVKLLKEEYDKLISKFGESDTSQRIENLSIYMASKGKKYTSHYAAILSWARKEPKQIQDKSWDYDLTKVKL